MTSWKKSGTRVGAGAFVVGLSLLGPQALGVACAEAGEAETTASVRSSGAPAAEAASANRAARRAAAVSRVSRAASGSPAGVVLPVRPAAAGGSVLDDAVAERGGGAAPIPAVGLRARSGVRAAASTPSASVRVAVPVGAAAAVLPVAAGGVGSPAVSAASATRPTAAVPAARSGSVAPSMPFAAANAAPVTAGLATAVNTLLSGVANWLSGLPAGNVSTFLEGALLMVRKTFFNQGIRVTPVQQTTSGTGQIKGTIGAINTDGDPLTYNVVSDPQFGTVEVLDNGHYVYTPGSGFTGSDSFTVIVAERVAHPVVNLFGPGGTGSREVTVQVGSQAATTPFADSAGQQTQRDAVDVGVYLSNASGHITVNKAGLRYVGTVTLSGVTDDTQLSWLDANGNVGVFTVKQLVDDHWPEFKAKAEQNGASIDLTVAYRADDGTNNALVMSNVAVGKNDDGRYVFAGQLAADPAADPNSLDQWDVLGTEYKAMYSTFRAAHGIGTGRLVKFTTVDLDFVDAAVFADTYTPASYAVSPLGQLDAGSGQTAPSMPGQGASAPATVSAPQSSGALTAAASAGIAVTASIPLGGSFVTGLANGEVDLWTDGEKTVLQGTGWGSAVTYLLNYSSPLKDARGVTVDSTFKGSIQGDVLTVTALGAGSTVEVGQVITGAGIAPNTTITEFMTRSSGGAQLGGLNGGLGKYKVSVVQTVAETEITQPDLTAVAPGFVVGLANGSVQLWSQTRGWTELHGAWGSAVTAISSYGEGIVVGLANGSVQRWHGPPGKLSGDYLPAGQALGVGDSLSSPNGGYTLSLQEDGNLVLRGGGEVMWASGTGGQGVTSASLNSDGNFVLYAPGARPVWKTNTAGNTNAGLYVQPDGNVVLYSGGAKVWETNTARPVDLEPSPWANTWEQLQGTGWNQPVSEIVTHGSGIVVALGGDSTGTNYPGAVEYWDPSRNWVELQGNAWNSSVTAMTAYGDGVAVGLRDGSVQYWDGTIAFRPGFTRIFQWGDDVSAPAKQQVTALLPYESGLIWGVGTAGSKDYGGIYYFTGETDFKTGRTLQLASDTFGSAVTTMIAVESPSVNDSPGNPGGTAPGVIIGLDNGRVLMWRGGDSSLHDDTTVPLWTTLKDAGWASGVRTIIPMRQKVIDAMGQVVDGDVVVVGLANGAVQQWSGDPADLTAWQEIQGPQDNSAASLLTEDVLKAAVKFGKGQGLGDLDFGAANGVGSSADPLFGNAGLLPPCAASNSCDGTYVPISFSVENTVAGYPFTSTSGATLTLGYDVNAVAYGYAYVPKGVPDKMVPGKWTMAMLVAVPTGPSLTLKVGEGGTIEYPATSILSGEYSFVTPVGMFAVGAGVDASLSATLLGSPESGEMTAYAHYVPGMLFAFNTQGKPKDFQLGYDAYADVSLGEFADLTGISITPTLTPYVTTTYGLFVPDSVWFIGGWSLFDLSLGYENPVSLTLTADRNEGASLELTSAGFITTHAGLLSGITSALSWDGEYQVYSVSKSPFSSEPSKALEV